MSSGTGKMGALATWFRDNVGGNAVWDGIKGLLVLLASGGALTYYRDAVERHLLQTWPRWVAWAFGFAGFLLGLIIALMRIRRRSSPTKESLPANTSGGDLVFEAPFYFCKGDSTPFCPRYWEASRRRLHLDDDWNRTRWECPDCHYVKVLDEGLPRKR